MLLFSKVKGLPPQGDFEFFDLNLEEDTPFFIDAYYFKEIKDDPHISNIYRTISKCTYNLLQLIRDEDIDAARHFCSHFSETKGTGIGYAKNKINGRGAGKLLSETFLEALLTSKAVASGVRQLEEYAVTCDGIDKDIISDIVLGMGKLGFIEFTQSQCQKYGIEMRQTSKKLKFYCEKSRTWRSDYFELPHVVDPHTLCEQEIILIPHRLLTDKTIYDARYFFRHVVKPYFKELVIQQNLGCVRVRKNGDKYVTDEDLMKFPEFRCNKQNILDFIEKKPFALEQFGRTNAPFRFEQLKAAS